MNPTPNSFHARSWIARSVAVCALFVCSTCFGDPSVTSDKSLRVTLFAEDPQIVTPIGLAIDDRDQVFVIESHTHLRPDEYDGPEGDRIKIFRDTNDDGVADQISVFAEDIDQAMNLAFSPGGDLYVVCARQVICLLDEDKDGICDRQDVIATLETQERYAHNSLLGITFDRDGWMYVARGNTGSNAYRFVGSDDTSVEGYGDGGSVIRCRPDGSSVQPFATGFWNPFDLKFDRMGRLLLVDNDPDARGPNRLLQVVQHGDYGYKSLFGGSGTHPFQGWDGKLPGTLPYIAGTGEAPSGLIDCKRTSFGKPFRNSILATIWNEHTIERYDLDPETGSLKSKSVFLSGDQQFRPVALDCDSKGNLYVTDWVLVDYPNHGRGRIWRISNDDLENAETPENYFAPYGATEAESFRRSISQFSFDQIQANWNNIDAAGPLAIQAAVNRLAELPTKTESVETAERQSRHPQNESWRIALLQALYQSGRLDPKTIESALADPSPIVRQAVVMYAALTAEPTQTSDLNLEMIFRAGKVTPELLESYLAAKEVMTEEFLTALKSKKGKSNKIPRSTDNRIISKLAFDPALTGSVRALVIARMDDVTCQKHADELRALFRDSDDSLAVAAMQAAVRSASKADRLTLDRELFAIASDPSRSTNVRTHAITYISTEDENGRSWIKSLLEDADPRVATQAHRSLDSTGKFQHSKDASEWKRVLTGGDALLGKHVFFSTRVGCAKCHAMDGRGGMLGPGLAGISQSKSPEQILDSIVNPSAEFAPQYQAWVVLTDDGVVHRGLQLDHKSKGAIELTLDSGETRYFPGDQVEAYRALPQSLMPDGLEQLMSVDEFRDLIAYLESPKQ